MAVLFVCSGCGAIDPPEPSFASQQYECKDDDGTLLRMCHLSATADLEAGEFNEDHYLRETPDEVRSC